MAKKIVGFIKLQVPAGKANPSPPIGPALGQRGLNIMEFCKAFNAQTQGVEPGLPLPVVITAYADKSFTFIIKTPPATTLIKKAIKLDKGSKTPHSDKVGKINLAQLEVIAKTKLKDMNAARIDAGGADIVVMDDLAARVKAGDMPFDVVIAAPDAMRVVGTLGQILGPRGLMPNPKVGTVTPDVATAVKNAKAGQVQYRADKAGIIHATIGRKSFSDADLKTNLLALIDALNKAKPATSKGVYLRKVSLSSTMGAGVRVDQGTLSA